MPAALANIEENPHHSLIDEYLERQQDLSAVERFSTAHDAHVLPTQARYYRELVPAAPPGPGQQYAFEVDLDACTGCKACVSACHTLNGLDGGEIWRSVGLLVGGTRQSAYVQHVTGACHHCVEPACMDGCPVLAYDKDPITGIVRHLDDQCIGCQYCILKCPYDVPKYNRKKGIVRKCDMCSDRLAEGEAPACAAACPNQAIRITLVDKQAVIEDSESSIFVPGAAEPEYTLPTTTYRSSRPIPRNVLPAGYHDVTPEHGHFALVVMLTLTQLSAGAFAVAQLLNALVNPATMSSLRPVHALLALGLGMLALGASTLHLGRPLYAFRAVLGLRKSWLSREIVAFGMFAGLASAYAAAAWLPFVRLSPRLLNMLGSGVAATGLLGVFCSAMIYHDTRRPYWRGRFTVTRFLLTSMVLGLSTMLLAAVLAATFRSGINLAPILAGWGSEACGLLIGAVMAKLAFEGLVFRHLFDRHHTPMRRSARLLGGQLLRFTIARVGLALLGGLLLPVLAIQGFKTAAPNPGDLAILFVGSFLMLLIGEMIERHLFFAAAVAPRMPGGFHA